MRIAFITDVFSPDYGKGGIGTYTTQIAGQLALSGWDVHVFAPGKSKIGTEISDGYTVHRIAFDENEVFRERLLSVFTEMQSLKPFDLVECPEINGNALLVKDKFPALRLVVRLHAPGHLVEKLKNRYVPLTAKLRFFLGGLRRGRIDRGYWRPYKKEEDVDYSMTAKADLITAPSNAMKQWAINNWQINDDKITVIPNPFLPSQNFLGIPVEFDNKYKKILFFGRLNALKGLVALTKSVKKILLEFSDWTFEAIGDDGPGLKGGTSMKKWMEHELTDVKDRVIFTDGVAYEILHTKLRTADFVVLPSLFESFSYTCVEAMAAGRAVIGSKNGGMADLLANGKYGIVVNPFSHKEIYIAIKKMILNPGLRGDMAIEARCHLKQEYGIQKITAEFKSFYKTVVDR